MPKNVTINPKIISNSFILEIVIKDKDLLMDIYQKVSELANLRKSFYGPYKEFFKAFYIEVSSGRLHLGEGSICPQVARHLYTTYNIKKSRDSSKSLTYRTILIRVYEIAEEVESENL